MKRSAILLFAAACLACISAVPKKPTGEWEYGTLHEVDVLRHAHSELIAKGELAGPPYDGSGQLPVKLVEKLKDGGYDRYASGGWSYSGEKVENLSVVTVGPSG